MDTTQALVGPALVTLGVAAGLLLAPQAASALDFTFSFGRDTGYFGGVTGLIRGLVDGQTKAPTTITVTNPTDPNDGGGTYGFGSGEGFTLEGDVITVSQWRGSLDANYDLIFDGQMAILRRYNFLVAGKPTYSPVCVIQRVPGDLSAPQSDGSSTGCSAGVPGPLPIFGAAAAFGYSRKLRKRIKTSDTTVSATPFARSQP